MSQNFDNETGSTGTTGTGGTTGGGAFPAGTGATDAGTTRDTGGTGLATSGTTSTGGGAGAATAPTQGIAAKAKEYGQHVAEYGQQAKEYISDKAGVVGEKFQDLRNKDYGQIADEAKQYARQNPGQAILISAAAGFVIGLLLRGGRRS